MSGGHIRWTDFRGSGQHVPLYAIAASGPERAPLTVFLISVVALSILYTWFWLSTGGSLLLALLLHSATNVAGVLLLRHARSDFGPLIIATALTLALATLSVRHLPDAGATAADEGRP